MIPQHRDVP